MVRGVAEAERDIPEVHEAVTLVMAGRDRPGILDELSHFAADRGARLGDIETAALAGQFALIARLACDDAASAGRVREGLAMLGERCGARAWEAEPDGDSAAGRKRRLVVTGGRAGDAADEAEALRQAGNLLRVLDVNISDLSTSPPTDGAAFELRMRLSVPDAVPSGKFRELLGQLFDGLGAGWDLQPADE